MIKLIASDLDGTLIDKNNFICEDNFKAIKDINNSSLDFVICTGKTYSILKSTCSKFNASYGIFGNGNQIVDLKTGKEIYKKLLTQEQINKCIEIAKSNNLHVHIYTDDAVITESLQYMDLRNYELQKSKYYDSSLEFIVVDDIQKYISNSSISVCKLVISSTSDLKTVKSEILSVLDVSVTEIKKYGKYKDTVIDKEYEYLDITPQNINKDTALNILGNYLNINKNEMLAIGDNLNDLDMVKNSGIGVAVGNAYNELKQIAKYTTTNSVGNGGFAEAVYKYVKF